MVVTTMHACTVVAVLAALSALLVLKSPIAVIELAVNSPLSLLANKACASTTCLKRSTCMLGLVSGPYGLARVLVVLMMFAMALSGGG